MFSFIPSFMFSFVSSFKFSFMFPWTPPFTPSAHPIHAGFRLVAGVSRTAAVVGRKKWILYPPHVTPPGVIPSADGVDVTVPLSIVEWFDNFYPLVRHTEADLERAAEEFPPAEGSGRHGQLAARKRRRRQPQHPRVVHSNDVDASSAFRRRLQQQQQQKRGSRGSRKVASGSAEAAGMAAESLSYENVAPLECIHKPGEILFIPSGWWHTVLNLDEWVSLVAAVVFWCRVWIGACVRVSGGLQLMWKTSSALRVARFSTAVVSACPVCVLSFRALGHLIPVG